VRVPAVDLDREALPAPEEVDLEAGDLRVGLIALDPALAKQPNQRPLAGRAGPPGPARQIEDRAQAPVAALPRVALELL